MDSSSCGCVAVECMYACILLVCWLREKSVAFPVKKLILLFVAGLLLMCGGQSLKWLCGDSTKNSILFPPFLPLLILLPSFLFRRF